MTLIGLITPPHTSMFDVGCCGRGCAGLFGVQKNLHYKYLCFHLASFL